jgi:GNAT superfamily N-acetyltransferase
MEPHPDQLHIRAGSAGDAGLVISLFDEAIAWMVARGQTGQWGSVPYSQKPEAIEQVRVFTAAGGLRVAEWEGEPVGAIALGERPPHVAAVDRSELYVQMLLTSRRHAGKRLGSYLIQRAVEEARDTRCELLRVDCWAGAPSLVAWYERQGFSKTGTFDVGGWVGQIFDMELGESDSRQA